MDQKPPQFAHETFREATDSSSWDIKEEISVELDYLP